MNIPSLVLFMKNSRLVGLVPCWQRTGAVISTKDRHILKERETPCSFSRLGLRTMEQDSGKLSPLSYS